MRTLQSAVRRATGIAQQLVLVAVPHGGQRRARVNALTALSDCGASRLDWLAVSDLGAQPSPAAYAALSG